MQNGTRNGRRAAGAVRVLITLVLAALAYMLFHLIFGLVYVHSKGGLRTASALYPIFNLALGVFVGYRLRRYGWAYAAAPIVTLTAIMCASDYRGATYLWLPYKLPVGLFAAILGGFIGEHLTRSE